LVVVPLHGRGNKNGEGAGVKVLAYEMPKNPHDEWKTEVICDDMHMTHNFDVPKMAPNMEGTEILAIAGKEGLTVAAQDGSGWRHKRIISHADYPTPLPGAGEVRFGKHPGVEENAFVAAIEPMHGNTLAVYTAPVDKQSKTPPHLVLDSTLEDGHALACGDLLGLGREQIVVGWRAMQNKTAKVGIKMFVPDEKAEHWQQYLIDDNKMSCEDLVLADLNGDGKLDIIASGRRTKNVKIYWNETK
jgi:hypothetical protein